MPTDAPGPVDRTHGRAAGIAALLILLLGLTACTSHAASANKTTPSTTGSGASATGSATGSATSTTTTRSTSATPTTPKPTSSTTLGGDCPAVLPVVTVDRVVGKPVPGKTSFIVNLPDYPIGQVQRINCQYGLATPAGKTTPPSAPLVEASVSLYNTAAHATARVAATRETWREHGASPRAVTVAGHPAVVLTGYGSPLLVLGVGARTVALSVAATLVPATRLDAVLTSLAASALHNAGG